MARDVEFAVTASDKSGMALASAEAKFKASQERIRRESKKTGDKVGDDLLGGASKAGAGMLGKLLPGFTTAGISGGQALAVGIAAAAPLIGATLSAAVIGGAGVGGVIGGVVLAARDPRVKAAGTALGESLLGQLERDAAPFVEPLLRNIAKVEVRFGQMNGRIKNIFAKSSGFLDPLVDGALAGIGGILRGVDALVSKAKPVIDQLGRTFASLGQATGDAFEIISGGSEEAADALGDLTKVLEFLIVGTGATIRFLTEFYQILDRVGRLAGGDISVFKKHADAVAVVGSTTSAAAAAQKTLTVFTLSAGEAAGKAGQQMVTYADRMDDAAAKGRSLYDSQTSVADAVARAKKALEQNGRTLSLNSEKGRENRNVLSQLASSLTANYQAYVKVNGEGGAAARIAENNRNQFIKLATQFGLTKTQASNLATQMGLIKSKKVDFYANTHDAAGRLKALQGQINGVHGKTVSVNVNVNASRLASIENRLNRLGGSLYNAAGLSFALNDSGSGVARTGGPAQVSVSNSLSVSLDGAPFRAMTVRAIDANNRRERWRQKVGTR